MAVHERRVGNPPKIQPVAIQLMICNHNQSLRESRLQSPIFCLHQLSSYRGIAADTDGGWREPLCHSDDEQAEPLLRYGHVGIVVIFADEIEGRTEEL